MGESSDTEVWRELQEERSYHCIEWIKEAKIRTLMPLLDLAIE